MMEKYGSAAQQEEWIPKMLAGTARIGFGLTEPLHGSDATWMETTAVRDGDEWVISGEKYWNTGLHHATHDYIFARTSGEPGDGRGITCFITPTDSPGFQIEEFMWTFNMPTDHAHVRLTEVRVSNDDILGEEGLGLQTAQLFVHENRIRQAASSLGAGLHCIDLAVDYANQRTTFGKRLSTNQAIQFPLADLAAEAEMLRALIQKTAWQLDAGIDHMEITDKVAMCNYRANRFCCNAADQAMQTCGGQGYNRAMPFEHIYRHHRRYRITEGSDEIQIRKVAGQAVRLHRPRQGLTAAHDESGRAAQRVGPLPLDLVGVDGVVTEGLDEGRDRDPHLESRERCAEAVVDSVTERDRSGILPVEPQLIGVGPSPQRPGWRRRC